MQSGLSILNSLDGSIPKRMGVWLISIITMFYRIPVFDANSEDPDQTPRSAASDLGRHCLPMSLLWDARHKWANGTGSARPSFQGRQL